MCICEPEQGLMLGEDDDDAEMKSIDMNVSLILRNGVTNRLEDHHKDLWKKLYYKALCF